ncbi:unnamed protein product [Citrullus colocynthis]|uniref:Uncharacterized protein n=1 Tax=Citrullus colocynthis TaxID=252529 RepID=A0ABP0Y9K5_9ROSI
MFGVVLTKGDLLLLHSGFYRCLYRSPNPICRFGSSSSSSSSSSPFPKIPPPGERFNLFSSCKFPSQLDPSRFSGPTPLSKAIA